MFSRLVACLRGLIGRRRAQAELDDELSFHVAMEARSHEARGLSPDAARRAALRDLGGIAQTKEAVRDVRTLWIETAWRDARYALRGIMRTRGLAAGAVLTLAMGIGANVAIFSLADPMFFRTLPYPDADRLVTAEVTGPEVFGRTANVADFLRLEAEGQTVDLVSTHDAGPRGYVGDSSDRIAGRRVSPNFLALFGVRPAAGRVFARDEYGRDARSRPRVTMISWRLWHSAFGGRDDAIGARLVLSENFVRAGGVAATAGVERVDLEVVGVLPRTFVFPDATAAPPAFLVPADVDPSWAGVPTRGVAIFARLRPGAEPASAALELTQICERSEAAYPMIPKVRIVRVTALQHQLFEDLRRPILLLLAAAVTVLLLTYVNLSHLVMASLRTRAHEMAVRRALGAGTPRLIGLVVAEVGWLCLSAAVAGVAAGQGLLSWAMTKTPEFGHVYRLMPAGIDLRVGLFAATLAGAALVVVALWPAWRLARTGGGAIGANVATHLGGRAGDAAWLIGLQAAFTVAILAAGALTVKSFAMLVLQPRGFDPGELRSLPVRLPPTVVSDASQTLLIHRQIVEALASVPGVSAVAMSASVPGLLTSGSVVDESTGKPIEDVWVHRIGGGFAQAAGLHLAAGRFFSDEEAYGGADVAIVDRRTADRLWPGEDPLGQTLRERIGRTSRVVGVVGTVSQIFRTEVPQPGLVLTPLTTNEHSLTISVRFSGRPPMADIRDVVRRIDDRLVIGAPVTHATYERYVGQPRFLATAVGGLAVLAGLLVACGVFAVASHAVLRRRRELAVRMAVGATRAGVQAMMVRHAIVPAVLGVAVGIVGAFWWAKALDGVLVGVDASDWLSYAAAAALSLLAIMSGVVWPAVRASRIDPALALRSE
jgi:predicted permease